MIHAILLSSLFLSALNAPSDNGPVSRGLKRAASACGTAIDGAKSCKRRACTVIKRAASACGTAIKRAASACGKPPSIEGIGDGQAASKRQRTLNDATSSHAPVYDATSSHAPVYDATSFDEDIVAASKRQRTKQLDEASSHSITSSHAPVYDATSFTERIKDSEQAVQLADQTPSPHEDIKEAIAVTEEAEERAEKAEERSEEEEQGQSEEEEQTFKTTGAAKRRPRHPSKGFFNSQKRRNNGHRVLK